MKGTELRRLPELPDAVARRSRNARKLLRAPARRVAGARRRLADNARFLAVVRRVDDPSPALAAACGRATAWRLRSGLTSWSELPEVTAGVAAATREAVDACDPDRARPLLELLRAADPRAAETHELAGHLAVIEQDRPTADEEFYASLPPTASVARRRQNASRRAGREQDRFTVRSLVASLPARGALATRRQDVLDAPFTVPGALESAAAGYAIRALLDGQVDELEPVFDLLQQHGTLAVSHADVPGVLSLVASSEAHRAEADYPGAHAALDQVPAGPEALVPELLLELATVLSARSLYTAARRALRLLATDGEHTGLASAREAQIAWIVHDDDGAWAAGRRAIRHGMPRNAVRTVLDRSRDPITPIDPPTGGLGHVAFYVDRGENFGDVALPAAVRESVHLAAGEPQQWVPFHAHQLFDDDFVRVANSQRGLVVGGGGLFLPDTSPNGHSGWQWNVPAASLGAIEVPLFVYTVGYNLFPGQEFRGSLFRESLVALAEKAEFLGLRNHGSMSRVRDLLPADLQDKVRFTPCATTVYERLRDDLPAAETGSGTVLFNAAFDRSARRFGDRYGDFLAQVHQFVEDVEGDGAHVRFVAHTRGDTKIAKDLFEAHGREVPVDHLHEMDPQDAYAVYRRASLVIGMRGHATMIPFGLGTPVLSVVSHPKLRYFLEDVGRPEWALDVDAADLGGRLTALTRDVLAREESYREDVRALQEPLLHQVQDAAAEIARRTSPA